MPASIKKSDVSCPHCGSTQQEPCGAVSTFCRSCGSHFDIGAAKMHTEPVQTSLLRRVRTGRTVHCYKCGSEHEVSPFAKTTLCPQCGTSIEIGDLVFAANTSRPVDLRGKLVVRKGANLNNSWIICTKADIAGKITGTLLCEEELLLRGSGKLSFQAHSRSTNIHKGADIHLAYPLVTDSLDLCGSLQGRVDCSGSVRIRRGASLIGTLRAAAITVDRGGVLIGNLTVRPREDSESQSIDSSGVFRPSRNSPPGSGTPFS